jgi:hypothetical protein
MKMTRYLRRIVLISLVLTAVAACVSKEERYAGIKSTIYLNDDEIGMFGYGSLVNVSSMEKTLGNKYSGPIILSYLNNWKRDWSVVMPNSYFYEETTHGPHFPKYILYLNVTPSKGDEVYGALFVIKKDELEGFKQREWIYDFKDVCGQIKDVKVIGGPVYTCVAKDKYRVGKLDKKTMAVRGTYINTVEGAYKSIGKKSLMEFDRTTEVIPGEFIIQDHKDTNLKNPFGYK